MKKLPKQNRGFTMIELMIVIVVSAIAIALAVPSFRDLFERKSVTGAAESASEILQRARSEALKRSKPILVDFNANGTDWTIGITDKMAGCNAEDASGANACTVEYNNSGGGTDSFVVRILGSDQRNITMSQATGFADPAIFPGGCTTTNNTQACFDFVRGLARTGAYDFDSATYKMRVEITQLGHVKVCVPSGEKLVVGYGTC